MPFCIPHATAVPGLSGPPNWFLPATPASPLRKEINDPRWIGAYSQGFGTGTVEKATFRALNHTDGTQPYLYFSWHVKFEDTISEKHTLYVGFTRAGHPPLILVVNPNPSPGFSINDLVDGEPAALLAAGSRNATTGKLAPFGNTPNWITESLRVWHHPGDKDWAVHLRVPIKAGATLEDRAGLDLSPTFKMWYAYSIVTNTDPMAFAVLRLEWPANAHLTYSAANPSPANPPGFVYPDPNSPTTATTEPWYEYNLGTPGTPCATTSGIFLDEYTSIGSDTPGVTDGEIKIDLPAIPGNPIPVPQPTNFLYAQPTNKSGSTIDIGALKARFSFANWGAIASSNAPWDFVGEAQNSATINTATTAPKSNVRLTWAPPASWVEEIRAGRRDNHQCMFVELSGAGLTFTKNSSYRNMDFVENSTYSRKAQISVVGLTPISDVKRDTYLAVEALNMPQKTSDQQEGGIGVRRSSLRAQAIEAMAAINVDLPVNKRERIQEIRNFVANYYVEGLDQRYNMSVNDFLDANLPTYRVHLYYDTGRRETIDGTARIILGLGSSYGYYGVTDIGADIDGWEHRLEGAIRIAENYYLLRVPNNGVAYVTNTLQSRAPDEQPLPEVPIQVFPGSTPLLDPNPRPEDTWWQKLIKFLLWLLRMLLNLLRRKP